MGVKLLDAADILAASDRTFEMVDCPEWGGQVCVGTMSGADRDEFEAKVYGTEKSALEQHVRVLLVAYCAVDEEGTRLFSDKVQIEALGRKGWQPIRRIAEVALRINALTRDSVEEMEKNSFAGEAGDFTSDSPSPSE